MSLLIKLSNGTQVSVDVPNLDISVTDLKEVVASKIDIPAEEQRVVCKGKVLKDGDVLSALGIEHGNAVHVVRSVKKKVTETTPANTGHTAAADSGQDTASVSQSHNNFSSSANVGMGSNPYAALSRGVPLQDAASNPFLNQQGGGWGGLGGGSGMSLNSEQAMQMLLNPSTMQMMQEMMRNPQFMQMMSQHNPMMANMPPAVLQQAMQMMNNPELMRQVLGAYSPGMPTEGQGSVPPHPSVTVNPDAGGMGMGAPLFSPSQPQGDPHIIFRDQLQQLRDMGFPNVDANIAALRHSHGDLNFAIERLLNP